MVQYAGSLDQPGESQLTIEQLRHGKARRCREVLALMAWLSRNGDQLIVASLGLEPPSPPCGP